VTVLSRPDRGVYDAINLGVQASKGDWVYVLGSDDRLHANETLAQARSLMRDARVNLVYGDVRVLGANHMVQDGCRYGGRFTLARLMGQNICQQAIFYRRVLFESKGTFDLNFRLWADWDFAQRVFVDQPAQWIDLVVADYAATGMSSGAQDGAFIETRRRRMLALWRADSFGLAVPRALLRQKYWDLRKRLAA
jgi:glycosyltransferase involved in cell wall biosynthesis